MAKKVTELPAASALDGTEAIPVVQDGVSKKATTQAIADLAAGGTGTVESVTGDGVDNTDPDNPVISYPSTADIGAWPLGGTEPTGFTANVVIPGNTFDVTIGQSGDRMGDFRVWSDGTVRFDGTTAAGLQSAGDVDLTSDTHGIIKLGASGHILTDNNAVKKGLQTAATGYVSDPRSYADKEYVDGAINTAVTGLYDDRGNYDASVNAYPSSGGSGSAGAILKGDVWTISVAGTLPTGITVSPGDTVRALIDTPSNTQANWAVNAASAGSTTPNASQTVAGKVEVATTAEAKAGTTAGGTGADLAIRPDVLREKLRANRTVTGTDAIVQGDSEGLIYFNSASAFNFTIDQLVIDSYTSFINIGAGTVTFVNGAGVTISGSTTLKQGQSGAIFYRSVTAPIITVSAEVVGLQDLYVPASSMYPRTSNGCAAVAQSEIATSLVNLLTLDFDQTTQEFAQFTISLPRNWNNGTVTAKFYWTAAAGTGGVVWAINGGAYSDDDALTAALGTAQTVADTLISTNDMHITSATAAITLAGSPADADFLAFQISRNPADGSDTLTADAKLIGIILTLTTDAAIAG